MGPFLDATDDLSSVAYALFGLFVEEVELVDIDRHLDGVAGLRSLSRIHI